MTTSHWLTTHNFAIPEMSADIVIVGAGFVGLSTAYWISEYRPDLKIIVLDRNQIGAGASGRNAGFLTKGSATFYKSLAKEWGSEKAGELKSFAEASLQLVYEKILKPSTDISFKKTSSLTLFQTERSKIEWSDDSFKAETFGFNWMNEAALPSGLRGKFYGAYESGPEYKINPVQLLNTLHKILLARNVRVIENHSAFELNAQGVLTEYNQIKCAKVILALNAYTPQFHTGFKGLISPRRAQMLAVELEGELESSALHYDSPERVYWRKTDEKTLIIGGKRLLDEENEQGDFEKNSSIIQKGLEDYITQQLKLRFKVIHRWSGIMGFTQHELPYSTKIEAALEAYMIGGFSGHGMGFGFKAAEDMAKLAVGKSSKSFFDPFKMVNVKL